tara:strand:+ start:987 stop:2660 length:1674 start_codon:yes stop_codon:yes gene_type:complete
MTYYTQTTYGTGYAGRSASTECHWGNPLVFTTHDGIEVYAGGSSRGGGWWKMTPLPDLAMGPDNEVKKGYSQLKVETKGVNMDGWKCMTVLEERKPPAVLEMDFPDYNVPQDCDKSFWEAIVLDIRERDIKTVHTMCMGGHGRTGIQLACLYYHLSNDEKRATWEDANALISEVRTLYCNKAVEAEKQQEYVAMMCGLPVGDTLGFHKYGGTTTTTKTTGATSKNSNTTPDRNNIDLLECDACELVMWEDDKIHEIEEGDLCYDWHCQGHMQDITEFAVKRHFASDTHNYQICLTTLDVCSDVSGVQLGVLSEGLMEKLHGENWKKILDRLMSQNGKNSVRGKMLRNLKDELKHPTSDNVLVVIDDTCSSDVISGGEQPDYQNKSVRGIRKWKECSFCDKSTSPDRLILAYQTNKQHTHKAVRACPTCVSESAMELADRIETVSSDLVAVDKSMMNDTTWGDFATEDSLYTHVEGVSPKHAYTIRALRKQNKHSSNNIDMDLEDIVEDKQIEEGLKELGLSNDEITDIKKNANPKYPNSEFDDIDWEDWEDKGEKFI